MKRKSKNKKQLDWNGGWSMGEASHHIGKKLTEKSHSTKKEYKRKKISKFDYPDDEEI